MAISTQGITLMKSTGAGGTYTKLVDIKSFPDMGSAPQTIETTTLTDSAQTFIKGIDASAVMEFTANYTVEDYEALLALKDKEDENFILYFGENGASGKFAWSGQLSVWVVGGGVNGVVDMKINIIPSSAISKISA